MIVICYHDLIEANNEEMKMYEVIRKNGTNDTSIKYCNTIDEALKIQEKLEKAYGNPGIYKIVSWN